MKKKKEGTARRYYVICDKVHGEIIGLVEAVSVAQARLHHARKTVDVRYAEQKDLLTAAKRGIESEVAGAEVEIETEVV